MMKAPEIASLENTYLDAVDSLLEIHLKHPISDDWHMIVSHLADAVRLIVARHDEMKNTPNWSSSDNPFLKIAIQRGELLSESIPLFENQHGVELERTARTFAKRAAKLLGACECPGGDGE